VGNDEDSDSKFV
jgi:hypothetical protein